MRAPGRWSVIPGSLLPGIALAQGADAGGAATGQSAWNWAIGIAALVIVLALARVMFGRRAGGRPR